MTQLMHDNPIPAGIYWLDVIGTERQKAFHAWMLINRDSVSMLRKEVIEPGFFSDDPVAWWVLFRVNSPVLRWLDSAKLGLPNVSKGETTRSDTLQRAPEQGVADYWGAAANDLAKGPFGDMSRAALVCAAIYFLTRKK